jgi:preprotein translocase subunit YajC
MSFFISDALAEAPAAAAGAQGGLGALVPFIVLFAVFYFLLIRPQQKRVKEHKKVVDALAKGDEIQTESGIMGKVVDLSENVVKVEIADNVQIKIRRQAIQAVLPKGSLKELA